MSKLECYYSDKDTLISSNNDNDYNNNDENEYAKNYQNDGSTLLYQQSTPKISTSTLGTFIDDLLEESHPFGKYQKKVLFFCMLCALCAGAHVISIVFAKSQISDELELSGVQKAILVSATFAGWLFGAFIWGYVVDKFGRRKGVLGALAMVTLFGVSLSAAIDFITLVVLRVGTGAQIGGVMLCSFTLLSEFIPPSNRGRVATLWQIGFSLGVLLMALAGYIIIDIFDSSWHWILGTANIPSLLTFTLLYFLLPESPRYLLVQEKYEELTSLLQTIVDYNEVDIIVQLPYDFSPSFASSENNNTLSGNEKETELENEKEKEKQKLLGTSVKLPTDSTINSPMKKQTDTSYNNVDNKTNTHINIPTTTTTTTAHLKSPSAKDLLSPSLRRTTAVLGFVWFTNSLVYYGLTLLAADLSDDMFFNEFLSGLVEIPGYFLAVLLVDRLGRKKSLGLFMLGSGVTIASMIAPVGNTGNTVFAMSGKLCISAAFALTYTFSSELFPTSIRGIGMGWCSFASRFGGIATPLLLDAIGDDYRDVPLGSFAGAAILSTLLIISFLPETKGVHMPDTLEETLKVTLVSGNNNNNNNHSNNNHNDNKSNDGDKPSGNILKKVSNILNDRHQVLYTKVADEEEDDDES